MNQKDINPTDTLKYQESTRETEYEDIPDWQEEGWEEEWEEEEQPYDVTDMINDAKETAMRAVGMDGRENYSNPYEHIVDHVAYHGIIGVMRGVIVTAFAIAAEIARVVVSTLTGHRDHFRFDEAVKQAKDALNLKEAWKKEKREKEQPEDASEKRAEVQKNCLYRSEPKISDEIAKKLETTPQAISDVLQDTKQAESVMSASLGQPNVREVFRELGVVPVQEGETDRIFLFSERASMDMEHISCVSREELLKGNANTLAAGLYQYTEKTAESQIESVVQAVVATAKVQATLQPELAGQGEKTVILSSAVFDTLDHNRAYMAAVATKDPNVVEMYYNDKRIGMVPLAGAIPSELYTQAWTKYQEDKNRVYQVKDISFSKEGKEEVCVEAGGSRQIFRVSEERDLAGLSHFLKEHSDPDYANAAAYLIGAMVNPGMRESRDEDGFAINPFTEQRKLPGDLKFGMQGPESNILQMSLEASYGGIREQKEELLSLRSYGTQMDLDPILETLKTALDEPSKNPELAAYQQPIAESAPYVSLFDSPMEGNGMQAYEKLKEQAILDGADLSVYRFVESQQSREKQPEHEEQDLKKVEKEDISEEVTPEIEDVDDIENVSYEDLMRVGYTMDGSEIDLLSGEEICHDSDEIER